VEAVHGDLKREVVLESVRYYRTIFDWDLSIDEKAYERGMKVWVPLAVDKPIPFAKAVDMSFLTPANLVTALQRRASRLRRLTRRARAVLLHDSVRIEASSKCQLRCPVCPTGNGSNRKSAVGWSHLTLADFRRFVEQNPRIRHVELSNWGEIFLNPELKGIIAYAHRHGIRLTANNGVNFNVASAEVIEQLVRCRFDRLTIAIDGTSEETYAVYRHGGSLRRVIANIERLNDEKRRHASRYPKLVWQFIVFGHNEHELPLARQMAAALGMRFFPKLHADHWDTDHSPVRDPDTVKAQSPACPRSHARSFGSATSASISCRATRSGRRRR
jgi:hypothetical protein